MPFQIIRNDITKVKADAIVNTANPKPRIGRGTDSAIYEAAGEEQLLIAREKIGEIAPGQAACTDAFNLNARYVIHTVGPKWIDGSHGERDVLHSCYEKSLALADELHCRSIAFPLIASGTYGFPKDEALHIALTEIQKFLLTHEMKVILVVFDRKAMYFPRASSEGLNSSLTITRSVNSAPENAGREVKSFTGEDLSVKKRPCFWRASLLLRNRGTRP